MSLLDAIILGIIQGLTEFLPVSSSGHLEIGKALLNIHIKENLLFSIVLHAATALSTIIVFRKDILEILKGLFAFKWNEETQFSAKIILSMIPVGVIGVLFKDNIEVLFEGQVLLVGAMLLLTGALLLTTNYIKKEDGTKVSFFHSVIIGLAQAVAIIPGISRSGATIATSLLLGVDKAKAARFSFLMVLPPIMGANLLEVKKYLEMPEATVDISLTIMIAGFITAFVVGIIACNWMIGIVKKGKLTYFAAYCFIVGILSIGASLI